MNKPIISMDVSELARRSNVQQGKLHYFGAHLTQAQLDEKVAALPEAARKRYNRALESFGSHLGNALYHEVEKRIGSDQLIKVADRWSGGYSELHFLDLNGNRIPNLPQKYPDQHMKPNLDSYVIALVGEATRLNPGRGYTVEARLDAESGVGLYFEVTADLSQAKKKD